MPRKIVPETPRRMSSRLLEKKREELKIGAEIKNKNIEINPMETVESTTEEEENIIKKKTTQKKKGEPKARKEGKSMKEKKNERIEMKKENSENEKLELEKVLPFLAKDLVDNEQENRDLAFQFLQEKLPVIEIKEESLIELWTALFYYVWLTESKLALNETVRKIAQLLFCLKEEKKALFLRSFWKQLSKEWQRIDKHRLDKYQQLVLEVLRIADSTFQQEQWSLDVLEKYSEMTSDWFFHQEKTVSYGLRLFYSIESIKQLEISPLSLEKKKIIISPIIELVSKSLHQGERRFILAQLKEFSLLREVKNLLMVYGGLTTVTLENRKDIYELCREIK